MSDNEPNLIKEFRELYDYVRLMGKHITQIYSRLEMIEKSLNEINSSHSSFIKENSEELATIRMNMVNKQEFNAFIEKMKTSIGEMLPPLPTLLKETPLIRESSH